MEIIESNGQRGTERPRYKWPWFILAALILAVLLAVGFVLTLLVRPLPKRKD